MLASEYEVFDDITDTMQKALADKKTRLECEARERYERDRTSLYNSGWREARKTDIIKSINIIKNIGSSKDTAIQQLIEQFELTKTEASELIELHWT